MNRAIRLPREIIVQWNGQPIPAGWKLFHWGVGCDPSAAIAKLRRVEADPVPKNIPRTRGLGASVACVGGKICPVINYGQVALRGRLERASDDILKACEEEGVSLGQLGVCISATSRAISRSKREKVNLVKEVP